MDAPGRVTAHELMDDPARTDRELRNALCDLGWINRVFGSHAIVRAYLDQVLPVWQARELAAGPLMLLDVATGGADVPQAVVRWGGRRGVPVGVVAVDRHPVTARLAQEATSPNPAIRVIQADARMLPFRDRTFDVCLCSLALHHLTRAEDLALLRRLHRLARIGFLAVDLLRDRVCRRLASDPLLPESADPPRRSSLRPPGVLMRGVSPAREGSGNPGIRVVRLPFYRVALAWIA